MIQLDFSLWWRTLARRTGQPRNNTWRQLGALSDATLRDIGMTRPALGLYLVDAAPARQARGKQGFGKPATARAGGLRRPVRMGI